MKRRIKHQLPHIYLPASGVEHSGTYTLKTEPDTNTIYSHPFLGITLWLSSLNCTCMGNPVCGKRTAQVTLMIQSFLQDRTQSIKPRKGTCRSQEIGNKKTGIRYCSRGMCCEFNVQPFCVGVNVLDNSFILLFLPGSDLPFSPTSSLTSSKLAAQSSQSCLICCTNMLLCHMVLGCVSVSILSSLVKL